MPVSVRDLIHFRRKPCWEDDLIQSFLFLSDEAKKFFLEVDGYVVWFGLALIVVKAFYW